MLIPSFEFLTNEMSEDFAVDFSLLACKLVDEFFGSASGGLLGVDYRLIA